MNTIHKPKVVNIDLDEYDVFIGRPSKWGNPFVIKPGEYTRKEALDKYNTWILQQEGLLQQTGELKGKVLGCYCKPKKCHGDTLLELANS